MRYEKSCGAILFTRDGGEILYVIIRSKGGDCGFPKGHMESGEDERTTALREIREEVGLCPELLDDIRWEECYPLPNKPGVSKRVVYFLGEFSGQKPRHQPEELSAVYLMPYEEALSALTFSETKKMLIQANDFLRK